MKNMNWKVIKTEHDYELVSNRLDELLSSELIKDSSDYDEYELLCLLIEDYENKHYKFNEPDPIDYIKFIMDQNGLTNKDMIPYFGSPSKVSEVLNRKRNLSLTMIRKLCKGLNIPAEILIQDLDEISDSSASFDFITNMLSVFDKIPVKKKHDDNFRDSHNVYLKKGFGHEC